MARLLQSALGRRPLRFLSQRMAQIVLIAILALLAWSSVAVPQLAHKNSTQNEAQAGAETEREPLGDFALYALIHQRVAAGENYYAAAMDAQRTNNYPTRPFVTVRLPTLAMLNAALGPGLLRNLEMLLLLGAAGAGFWRWREREGVALATAGAVLILLGGAGVMAMQAASIHELASGLLLCLAALLYSRERLWPSLLAAALALSLRELALPFVLLWLGFAVAERRWREAVLVAALVALFALGLWIHAGAVAAQQLPGDAASPGWQALAGPAFPLLGLAQMSALTVLPLWLAGPLALLPLLGWIGVGERSGLFAALWSAGFFLAMAIFARFENFYWALMVLPLYLAGLAFVPRALGDLLAVAAGRIERQS